MSFSAPNQRFCEVNLSFGLSRRNFMSLVKTGRAQWNPTAPAEPVEKLAAPAEELPSLQKSYRAYREARRRRIPSTGYCCAISRCASRAESPALPSRGAPTPRAEPHDRAEYDRSGPHAPGTARQLSTRSPSLHPPQWRGWTDPPGRRRTCESAPPVRRGPGGPGRANPPRTCPARLRRRSR